LAFGCWDQPGLSTRSGATNGTNQVADTAPAVDGGEVTVRDARHDGSGIKAVTHSVPELLRVLIITLIRLVPIHAGHHAHRIIRGDGIAVNTKVSERRHLQIDR
jgi:hypothetical protein